ncbi:MAG: bifunctional sugar phosphate isomerase/epimerase/4-hydroxyphenylpyruvate dioxygenase family protein [Acetobacteraceae bacterium]
MSAPGHRWSKSIATVSLSGTLPEKLETIAAIGFDGVEIFENDLLTFAGTPEDVRRMALGLGLTITLYQPFRDFEAMPEPQRTRNLDRGERKFDVMQALGADLILVCSSTHPAAIGDDARAAADLAELAQRAAKRGLRIGYEALAWGRHVNDWDHAWRIVQQAGHPALGLILDSFHTLALDDDFSGIAKLPAERIFFVQLADAPKLATDVLSLSRHFRNFPAQGALDVAGFTHALLASGYRGPLSLEIFNDEFRAQPSRPIARDGLRSLIYVESEAGGPALPPGPVLHGIEFIEWALDDASGQELARFLEALGFRHAGTHRTKAVELYRQGEINLVLNMEPDSAASEHFHLHGPSVCAMALRVDSANSALERAEALLCSEWHERVSTGERHIPAVRAPDGMLIYLLARDPSGRSIWEDDFLLHPGASETIGLTRADHVAQALPAGRMGSFVLFYRSVFGCEPEQLWELADPYGMIQSRAVSSPDGSVRIALNVSESRETETGRFISAYAGAGVHHIALATDDIEATLGRLRELGAEMLPIPANYYDDLGSRWGLSDAAVQALQRLDLLYDREDAGEFRHAYTVSFAGRFFFEIVERRGYRGFGAANAGVRMAAQAQLRIPRGYAGFDGV